MNVYTKLTKAELIEVLETTSQKNLDERSKDEKEIQRLNKEVQKLNGEINTLNGEFERLNGGVSISQDRIEQLKNESFEKQRSIHTLTETLKQKDEQIGFLENQLNGLSDLFNELYLGLKDQNSLLGVYSRNINNFQERIDVKIAKFNTPSEEKNKK